MKINVTLELTRAELLEAITDSIKEAHRYESRFPRGEALDFEVLSNDAFAVVWGEKPEPEPEPVDEAVATITPVNNPAEATV